MKACTLVERCKYTAAFEFSKTFQNFFYRLAHFFDAHFLQLINYQNSSALKKNLLFFLKK